MYVYVVEKERENKIVVSFVMTKTAVLKKLSHFFHFWFAQLWLVKEPKVDNVMSEGDGGGKCLPGKVF